MNHLNWMKRYSSSELYHWIQVLADFKSSILYCYCFYLYLSLLRALLLLSSSACFKLRARSVRYVTHRYGFCHENVVRCATSNPGPAHAQEFLPFAQFVARWIWERGEMWNVSELRLRTASETGSRWKSYREKEKDGKTGGKKKEE